MKRLWQHSGCHGLQQPSQPQTLWVKLWPVRAACWSGLLLVAATFAPGRMTSAFPCTAHAAPLHQ